MIISGQDPTTKQFFRAVVDSTGALKTTATIGSVTIDKVNILDYNNRIQRVPSIVTAVSSNVIFAQDVTYVFIQNPTTSTDSIFLKADGGTATADNNCTEIIPGGTAELRFLVPVATGISLISASGSQNVYIEGQWSV